MLGNGPLMLGNGPHVLGNGAACVRPYDGIMSFEIMPHLGLCCLGLCCIPDCVILDYITFGIVSHSGLCCLGLCCILDCVIRDYVVWYTVRVSVYQVKIFSSTVQFNYRHIQKTFKNFDLYVCRHIQGTVKIFLSLR